MKKILMISSQYPYPQRCGFTVRLGDMCEYLSEHFDIHLLVYDTGNLKELHRSNVFYEINFYAPPSNKRSLFLRIKNRICPPHFDDSYYLSDAFVNKVVELHQQHNYDICMIHTPAFARCIHALPNSVYKVVDTHDIWHQKYSEFDKIGCGKLLYHYRDKNHELDFYRKMDLVLAISLWDIDYLKENGIENSIYVPLSFEPQPIQLDKIFNNEILYPAGEGPNNIDAIDYFIKEVLPLVKQEVGKVKFKILNPCEEIQKKYSSYPDVLLIPFLENIIDAYRQTDIVIIPLRVKSGLKIKLLESFSYGVPTILSSAAAQGVHLEGYPQKNFSLEPDKFAHEIIKALSSSEYRHDLSEKGLDIIAKYYYSDTVYSELIELLSQTGQDL